MKPKKIQYDTRKNLIVAIFINIIIALFETILGMVIGSMALIADAGHPSDPVRTYGYKRAEIIVAFVNSSALMVALLFIFIKSFQRLVNPDPIKGSAMIAVALTAFIGNSLAAYFLERGSSRNLNLKIAWLHSLQDALFSVGVVIGAIIIHYTDWFIIDPVISIALSLLVFNEAWKVIVETVNILMDSVPNDVDYNEMKADLLKLQGVEAVKDLHIWQTGSQNRLMSIHVKTGKLSEDARIELIHTIQKMVLEKYRINHTTIQTAQVDASDEHCNHCN